MHQRNRLMADHHTETGVCASWAKETPQTALLGYTLG